MSGIRIVVVGTGTGVGKTHVACALIGAAARSGQEAVGLKPVETGVPGGGDVASLPDQERLWLASEAFHVKQGGRRTPGVRRALYALPDPVSPHLAARRAGVRIALSTVRRWVEEHACALTVVETAGGLFSPLDRGLTNFDLVRALRPAKVLLVAPDRLGVLHDVTTTLGFARVCGLPVDALVLATLGASGDSSTGENAAELAHLCIATPVAVFPHAAPSADGSQDAAQAVLRRLTSPTQTTSSKL